MKAVLNEVLMSGNQVLQDEEVAPDLSIVIVNWNTRDLLVQCLGSIYDDRAAQQRLTVETIVVDNGSKDGSVQAVRERFPAVRVIENEENVGFASANNQAIVASRGRFVLLLNSDTIVMPGAVLRLFQFMDEHPDAAGVGARILNADQTLQASCFPFPTVWSEFWYLLHLDTVGPYAEYRMERWTADRARSVDVLLGACLLLRRRALDQVGLLDEAFFMYSEEVDLCYRLHKGGWRLYWVPEAEVVHYGAQSTRQAAPEMFLHLYGSKIRYFRKHHGRLETWLYKAVLLLASLPRVLLPTASQFTISADRKQYKSIRGNYRRLITELPKL